MVAGTPNVFFFVHVMKTGGTSLVRQLRSVFAPDEVYPPATDAPTGVGPYSQIDGLRSLPDEQRRRIRLYAGHFPFVAVRLVPTDAVLSILRDPVERTVSCLRHCRRHHPNQRDRPLEEIYDDPFLFPMMMHNYQVKQFAMDEHDKLESHLDVIDVDERRFDLARRNLECVDVLGVQEHFGEFLADLHEAFGWDLGRRVPTLRASTEDWAVPPSLRRRIVADNAADLDFFHHAQHLRATRRRGR